MFSQLIKWALIFKCTHNHIKYIVTLILRQLHNSMEKLMKFSMTLLLGIHRHAYQLNIPNYAIAVFFLWVGLGKTIQNIHRNLFII